MPRVRLRFIPEETKFDNYRHLLNLISPEQSMENSHVTWLTPLGYIFDSFSISF